jgi:hypothetical protein
MGPRGRGATEEGRILHVEKKTEKNVPEASGDEGARRKVAFYM